MMLIPPSLLDYAEDLEMEIRQLDIPPISMGHSMGRLLAQILASRGLAEALVLLTPAPPNGIMALKPSVIKRFWSVMKRWGFWKNPMRITFNDVVYSILNLVPAAERREIYDKFVL
jgi:pimeloyl-ACP methyl ester carboxylesterase